MPGPSELFFITSRILHRGGGYWVEVSVDGQRAPERDFGPFASVESAEQARKDFQDMLGLVGKQRGGEG